MIKLDYELIDSGDGYRLERFESNVVSRPDSTVIWSPRTSIDEWKYDASAKHKSGGQVSWEVKKSFEKPWKVSCGHFSVELRLSNTKNIGIFPEQEANWKWIEKKVKDARGQVKVLNLFGYTGVASLAAASAGAQVTHVDSSTSVANWFLKNKKISDMEGLKIRHIVEDCIKFAQREFKRGNRYDGILLDPPAFGRGVSGEVFKFEENVPELLAICAKLLKPKPLFVLLNSYSMGYSPYVIANLLEDYFPKKTVECNDLVVEGNGRVLPCGIYARFSE